VVVIIVFFCSLLYTAQWWLSLCSFVVYYIQLGGGYHCVLEKTILQNMITSYITVNYKILKSDNPNCYVSKLLQYFHALVKTYVNVASAFLNEVLCLIYYVYRSFSFF